MSERDYADLDRDDIAVYNFRGYTVMSFNKETFKLEMGKNAHLCSFITEDIKNLSEFLDNCYLYTQGMKEYLKHVEVN